MWLLDTLADFVSAELYGHLIGCLAPKSEHQRHIRAFTAACYKRIGERLLALVEQSKAAVRTSNGRELVVVKDAKIKAFMKEQGIRLRMCSGSALDFRRSGARRRSRRRRPRQLRPPVTGAAGCSGSEQEMTTAPAERTGRSHTRGARSAGLVAGFGRYRQDHTAASAQFDHDMEIYWAWLRRT